MSLEPALQPEVPRLAATRSAQWDWAAGEWRKEHMSWRFRIRVKAETRWSQVWEADNVRLAPSAWPRFLVRGTWVMSGLSPEGPGLSPQMFSPNPVSLLSLGLLPALATLGSAHEGCLLGLMGVMTELKCAGFGPNQGGRREWRGTAGIVPLGTKEEVGRSQLAWVSGPSVTASSVHPSVFRTVTGYA